MAKIVCNNCGQIGGWSDRSVERLEMSLKLNPVSCFNCNKDSWEVLNEPIPTEAPSPKEYKLEILSDPIVEFRWISTEYRDNTLSILNELVELGYDVDPKLCLNNCILVKLTKKL